MGTKNQSYDKSGNAVRYKLITELDEYFVLKPSCEIAQNFPKRIEYKLENN